MPDLPVLVLSHSLGTDLTLWDPQMPAFVKQFRVLRHDLRGHGGSSATAGPYTIELLARDVLALLDGLGIARAHFCGLSIGGQIGLWLGLHASDRLHKLVVCNSAARIGTDAAWNARIEAVRRGGVAAIAEGVIDGWLTPAFRARASGQAERLRRVLLATPPAAYAAACAAVRDFDARETVAGVRAPTLVVSGSADKATTPAEGRFLAERIPGARYLEVAAAHLSNVEAAETFTSGVAAFLAE